MTHVNSRSALEAADFMGLSLTTLTPELLTTAYRLKSKDCHPNGQTPDLAAWTRLIWAQGTLGKWLAQDDPDPVTELRPACRACGGTGYLKTAFGPRRMCRVCDGVGAML